MLSTKVAEGYAKYNTKKNEKAEFKKYLDLDNVDTIIDLLKNEMEKLAKELKFEEAAEVRDRISELEKIAKIGEK